MFTTVLVSVVTNEKFRFFFGWTKLNYLFLGLILVACKYDRVFTI